MKLFKIEDGLWHFELDGWDIVAVAGCGYFVYKALSAIFLVL
jgi:hypothetical protein